MSKKDRNRFDDSLRSRERHLRHRVAIRLRREDLAELGGRLVEGQLPHADCAVLAGDGEIRAGTESEKSGEKQGKEETWNE